METIQDAIKENALWIGATASPDGAVGFQILMNTSDLVIGGIAI